MGPEPQYPPKRRMLPTRFRVPTNRRGLPIFQPRQQLHIKAETARSAPSLQLSLVPSSLLIMVLGAARKSLFQTWFVVEVSCNSSTALIASTEFFRLYLSTPSLLALLVEPAGTPRASLAARMVCEQVLCYSTFYLRTLQLFGTGVATPLLG
jgi:hypothetical protein